MLPCCRSPLAGPLWSGPASPTLKVMRSRTLLVWGVPLAVTCTIPDGLLSVLVLEVGMSLTAPSTRWGNFEASAEPGFSGIMRPPCPDRMSRGLMKSAGSYFLNFGSGLFGIAKGRFLELFAGL